MAEYGVYAQPGTEPAGKAAVISVFPPLIGSGPGQFTMFQAIQMSTPAGIPFGIFEYPSEEYPENFDFDGWYPSAEETSVGIGTQGA